MCSAPNRRPSATCWAGAIAFCSRKKMTECRRKASWIARHSSSTMAARGTNADVLSDLLADLPIRAQKERIDPQWHRDTQLLMARPDLIVIHYSGFCEEQCTDRSQLRRLVDVFAESRTRFLIY